MTPQEYFANMTEEEKDAFFDRVTESLLKEEEERTKKTIAYVNAEGFSDKVQSVVEYLKEHKRFVWDGYPSPEWTFPIPYDETSDFVTAILHGKEGTEDEEAMFSTVVYDCGEILVEVVSGQGTIDILKIKE